MTVSWADYVPGSDASALVQAALDAGGAVQLPEQRLTLARPVYAASDCELRGIGQKCELYSPQYDGLLVMPAYMRSYDPAGHIVPNALDASRWAFRSRRTPGAGLRFHNTVADAAWNGADNWRAVRQFAVEMNITRHGGQGAIAGAAWRTGQASFRPSPWILYQFDWVPEYVYFHFTLADDSECKYRCTVGLPSETPFKLVVKVNLDAGTLICEKDGAAVPVQRVGAVFPAGASLNENRGSPLWLGGVTEQAGGHTPPELDQSNITFHSFRIWKTATPPASGYPLFATSTDTAFVLPMDDASKPKVGDPAVAFTGMQNGFGYCVPLEGSGWAVGARVEGVTFVGGAYYGTGLSIISAIDVAVNRCRFQNGRVGLQIMGGPLPNYPVRIRDLYGDHQYDCLARIHRSIVREFENVTAKYPGRSVARFDQCGEISIRDVFHAGENAGPNNSVTDCLRFDGCGRMSVEYWLSNYEDITPTQPIGGPRYSYLHATGSHPEPTMTQLLRVSGFAKQALRAGAKYIDDTGLSATCVRQITDSFDIPPVPVVNP